MSLRWKNHLNWSEWTSWNLQKQIMATCMSVLWSNIVGRGIPTPRQKGGDCHKLCLTVQIPPEDFNWQWFKNKVQYKIQYFFLFYFYFFTCIFLGVDWGDVFLMCCSCMTCCSPCFQINQGLCEKVGIKRSFCAPYHPQTNGMVERMNGTIQRQVTFG